MAKKDQTQTDELQLKVDELTSDLQRLQADFVNFRRRTDDERVQLMNAAKASVLTQLLPLIDNIERALVHMPAELENNQWAKGVSQLAKQLEGALKNLGVEKIQALDQPFNPNTHEAVSYADEGEGEERVVEVLQDGYTANGQVLRHAMVKVGKTTTPVITDEEKGAQ